MHHALNPGEDLAAAGVTQCQHYLPLVAEGRIDVKPWMTAIDGQTVQFSDGTANQFDGLIFGTGFELSLPFLSGTLRQQLGVGAQNLDLYKCTFHPALPDLAFAGLFQVAGPYFPPIELQARWISRLERSAAPAVADGNETLGSQDCRPNLRQASHAVADRRLRAGSWRRAGHRSMA